LEDQISMKGDWKYGIMGIGEQYAMMRLKRHQQVLFVRCLITHST
jgi:hypothetical protein